MHGGNKRYRRGELALRRKELGRLLSAPRSAPSYVDDGGKEEERRRRLRQQAAVAATASGRKGPRLPLPARSLSSSDEVRIPKAKGRAASIALPSL